MSYQIQWDNDEKTVVLQQYHKPVCKDDLYHLARESAQMLSTVSHTVHLIVDERNSHLVISTTDMAYLEKLMPKNQGVVVLVVPKVAVKYKTLVQDIGKVIAPKAFDHPFFTETLEDAREFLMKNLGVHYGSE